VLLDLTSWLCDVTDMETGLIVIGDLDQFKLSFGYVDVRAFVFTELYTVHVFVTDLADFIDGSELTGCRHFHSVIMNELSCSPVSPFPPDARCALSRISAPRYHIFSMCERLTLANSPGITGNPHDNR
jgi:hypothetical protein